MKFLALLPLFFAGVLFAQADVKSAPAPAPKVYADPTVLSATLKSENAILLAEHKLDQANAQKQRDEQQFNALKADYQQADQAATAAAVELGKAVDDAYVQAGYSKTDYDFDVANFTFTAKPKPAATPVVKGADSKKP